MMKFLLFVILLSTVIAIDPDFNNINNEFDLMNQYKISKTYYMKPSMIGKMKTEETRLKCNEGDQIVNVESNNKDYNHVQIIGKNNDQVVLGFLMGKVNKIYPNREYSLTVTCEKLNSIIKLQ